MTRPCATWSSTAAAVIILLTDAHWKRVSGVTGVLGGAVGEADTVLHDRHTGLGEQHRAGHAAGLELGEPAAQAILGSVVERECGHAMSIVAADGWRQAFRGARS